MRDYYLFKLRNNSINSKKVYLILEELFYLNRNKFNYGFKIFNDLCLPIDKSKFINYEKNITINNTYILIKNSINISSYFKYFNNLEKHLFVCDFDNKDYFYLNDFVRLNLNRY